MNLHGSIIEHQNRIAQLYLKLEQRFSENFLIREVWCAMAKDVSQQVKSLNALPNSLWNHLKKNQNEFAESVLAARKTLNNDNKEDLPLRACFDRALQIEEPTILNIYVPIIRRLRENWTDQALDFYIMVKAHLARIARIAEAFSGDPLIIQRSSSLLNKFENEVQKPNMPIVLHGKTKKSAAKTPVPAYARKQTGKARKPARPLIKHSKIRSARAKPILSKIGIRRRRAQR
jgi:hypothetical protein